MPGTLPELRIGLILSAGAHRLVEKARPDPEGFLARVRKQETSDYHHRLAGHAAFAILLKAHLEKVLKKEGVSAQDRDGTKSGSEIHIGHGNEPG